MAGWCSPARTAFGYLWFHTMHHSFCLTLGSLAVIYACNYILLRNHALQMLPAGLHAPPSHVQPLRCVGDTQSQQRMRGVFVASKTAWSLECWKLYNISFGGMCLISHNATNHMTMLAEVVTKACNHQNCAYVSRNKL